ncbi:MAG: alcohol dehydrogenase catalytic domain-containing protein [Pseudomonadota bacterium]
MQGFAVGDSVVVTLIRSCGTCPSCASGKPTVCETRYDNCTGPIAVTVPAASCP